jgi:hypothetical protein
LHNNYWDNNSATLNKKPIIPFIYRVFNNTLELGGRFYGSFQGTPSNERTSILFNRRQTVEVDYSAIHIAIMYAWAGVDLIGDPYQITGYERSTVKAIMLRLVNVKSIEGLKKVITDSAKESRKAEYKEYKNDRRIFETQSSKKLAVAAPYKPKWIDSHIQNIPTGFNARGFIESLFKRHSAIEKYIGSDDIGLKLQAADSALMADVLIDLYDRPNPIPALPVHDSLVCRHSNIEVVKATMKHYFKERFKAQIELKISTPNLPKITAANDHQQQLNITPYSPRI